MEQAPLYSALAQILEVLFAFPACIAASSVTSQVEEWSP